MEYLKNVVAGLFGGVIAAVIVVAMVGGNSQPVQNSVGGGSRYPNGLSTDSTSPSAGEVRTTTLTVTGASSLASGTFSSTLDVTGVSTLDTLEQGGGNFSSSTSNTSETFIAADMDTENIFVLTPNTGATTYTLPASSTLSSIMTAAGDWRTYVIVNATTTTGVNGVITIAGSAGIMLKNASTTLAATETATLRAGEIGVLNLFRATSTRDIVATFSQFR